MSKEKTRIPPALKHGCYSNVGVLPTEDRVAFEKLRRDVIAEYDGSGPSEESNLSNMAAYIWRRDHLATYRVAEYARRRHSAIYAGLGPPAPNFYGMLKVEYEEETRSAEELQALRNKAKETAKRELGSVQELIGIGDVATPDDLQKELELREHLDGMIARCLKELMMIRGAKSLKAPS